MMIRKQTLIYLSEQQHEALRDRAHEMRTSMSELIRGAVDAYLNGKALPIGVHKGFPLPPERQDENKKLVKQPNITVESISVISKCEAPNTNCKFPGELYEVQFQTDEGLGKKKIYLCPGHAKKAQDTSESVVKL